MSGSVLRCVSSACLCAGHQNCLSGAQHSRSGGWDPNAEGKQLTKHGRQGGGDKTDGGLQEPLQVYEDQGKYHLLDCILICPVAVLQWCVILFCVTHTWSDSNWCVTVLTFAVISKMSFWLLAQILLSCIPHRPKWASAVVRFSMLSSRLDFPLNNGFCTSGELWSPTATGTSVCVEFHPQMFQSFALTA